MRSERFETPGEVTLDVRLPAGLVELEAAAVTSTEVELDARGSGDEVRELLDEARIELREARGGHEVLIDLDGRTSFWADIDVRLVIRAPEGAHLRLETASADLQTRGRLGSVEAKTASGDIELDEVTGDAVAKSASGDVAVRAVGGAAVVNTASGDVELDRVAGEVVVKTASGDATVGEAGAGVNIATSSGDQRIAGVTSGSVNLQSASGDISIGIRQGSNVWVDARAMSGDLSSELELADEPPSGDAPLVELRATSMSGDVTVVRAPAAAEAAG
jgi:putative adhesin